VAPALDFQQDTLLSPPHQGNFVQQPVEAQPSGPDELSSDVIHFRQDPALRTEARPPGLSRTIPQFTDVSPAESQLQLKRLEFEHERKLKREEREQEIRRMELERQERERERERERQFQLRKLELEISRDASSSSQPAALAYPCTSFQGGSRC